MYCYLGELLDIENNCVELTLQVTNSQATILTTLNEAQMQLVYVIFSGHIVWTMAW